jgi:hypothetical protein
MLKLPLEKMEGNSMSIGLSAGDTLRPSPFFFVSREVSEFSKKVHALDFDAETLIPLSSVCAEAISDDTLLQRLCDKIKYSLNQR